MSRDRPSRRPRGRPWASGWLRAPPFLFPLLLVSVLAKPCRAGATDVLACLSISDANQVWAFIDEWEEAGARFPHFCPPDILIGDLDPSLEAAFRADPRVAALYRRPAPLGAAKSSSLRAIVIRSWNGSTGDIDRPALPRKRAGAGCPPFRGAPLSSTSPPPGSEEEPPEPYGRAFGATTRQTSEFLLGRVAVGLVLPDSPGHRYLPDEVASIYGAVRGAMGFWTSQVKLQPGLRMVYDLRYGVETTMNFLDRPPRIDEEIWVPEIMEQLGYASRTSDPTMKAKAPVYAYVDSLRSRYATEWGICIFIPKTPSFPASYVSYSHLGGPFLVVPSGFQKDTGWLVAGESWLSHLVIHDVGHLFWALDESCGSGFCISCRTRSGYLYMPNRNSLNRDYTCDHHVACTMDIPAGIVCDHTLAMVGIYDSDDDGIPDLLDTHPYVSVDSLADTVTTIRPRLEGIAAVMPLLNHCGYAGSKSDETPAAGADRNEITFNTIEHVLYRIDEMTDDEGSPLWLYADPPGGFGDDSTRIHFSFVPDSLTGGEHRIAIRAVNTIQNQSIAFEFADTVFVKAIALHDFAALPDYGGAVRVSYRVRGGTFGAEACLYRSIDGGPEKMIRAFPLLENSTGSIVDATPTPGERTAYRLEVSALGMTWEYESRLVSPAPIVRGEHLSAITPNPFRDRTVISFDVPRGGRKENSHSAGKPGGTGNPFPWGTGIGAGKAGAGGGRYNEARVEVDIFNLAGRLVRSFPPVHDGEGIHAEPFLWDGADGTGRRLPAGFYFVRMRAGEIWETRKVLLLP